MYFVFIFLNFKYSSLRERKKNAACLGLKVLALHVFHFLGVKKKKRREREVKLWKNLRRLMGGGVRGRIAGRQKEAKIGKGGR